MADLTLVQHTVKLKLQACMELLRSKPPAVVMQGSLRTGPQLAAAAPAEKRVGFPIFIGDLPNNICSPELGAQLDQVFGSLADLQVRAPRNSSSASMKYGVATFLQKESALKALAELPSWTWQQAVPSAGPAGSRVHHLSCRAYTAERP